MTMKSKDLKELAADLKIRINNQMQFETPSDREDAYLVIDGFLQQNQLTKEDLYFISNRLGLALIVKDHQLRVYYNLNSYDYLKSVFDKEWKSFWTANFTYWGILTSFVCSLIGCIPMIIGFMQNNLGLFKLSLSATLAAVIVGIISMVWDSIVMYKLKKVKLF